MDVPLHEARFCVVDLETTGLSPSHCEIVEVGAVRSTGGVVDGTLSVLVRPEGVLPAPIQQLTGIAPSMLQDAPGIGSVLPSLLEFLRGCVFVAHNARFDASFIHQACLDLDYEPPSPIVVDTARLARRILPDGETPNRRLDTLAQHLRTRTPTHRAFADAATCLEVLHAFIERASAYGVFTLDDLLELQDAPPRGVESLRLTRNVRPVPGVYVLRDATGSEICRQWSTDIRAHLRRHLLSSSRSRARRPRPVSVDWWPCDQPAEQAEAASR